MTREAELIGALAEDLALEMLASSPSEEEFHDVDFTSRSQAAAYREEQADGVGPALQKLIARVQSAAGTSAEGRSRPPEPPPAIGEP